MSTPPDLVRALQDLERALADFSAAYSRWLEEGGEDGPLKELLALAEKRLDEAREALVRAQDALRA